MNALDMNLCLAVPLRMAIIYTLSLDEYLLWDLKLLSMHLFYAQSLTMLLRVITIIYRIVFIFVHNRVAS